MPDNNTFPDQSPDHQATASRGVSVVAEGLGKRFNREWIFRNLNFTFSAGKTYAITGPNGSGKSTLLQVLWGQLPHSEGQVQYRELRGAVAVEDIARKVAIATPYMDLIEDFTLKEHLEFHFRLKPSRNNMSIEDILDKLYLAEAADKFIHNFSSGMKQRLKLGLALYTDAAMVFLDEPGTNLDSRAFAWYRGEMESVRSVATVFIASNDPDEVPDDAVKLSITDYKARPPM